VLIVLSGKYEGQNGNWQLPQLKKSGAGREKIKSLLSGGKYIKKREDGSI